MAAGWDRASLALLTSRSRRGPTAAASAARCRGVGDVAGDGADAVGPGQPGDGGGQPIGVPAVDDEPPAAVGQGGGEGSAEAPRGAGDECGAGGHGTTVEPQVDLRSRGAVVESDGDRRGGRPLGDGAVGAALLRGAGADQRHPHAGRRPALSAQRAAPAGGHPGGPQRGPVAARDPHGAGLAAGGPPADRGRLGAALPRMAGPAGRADRRAHPAARRADLLHRLRLPVAGAVRAVQPRRRGRGARAPGRAGCRRPCAACPRRADRPPSHLLLPRGP